MTTTLDVDTVVASIAALDITDVKVHGISGVSDSMLMNGKVLAPRPEKFITGARLIHVEQTQQLNNFVYTLHYRYYHCSIAGGLGGLTSSWPGLLDAVASILVALSSHSTLPGSVDSEDPQVESLGPVQDPAGNYYLGAEIAVTILQFLEA
jgi:hypothetical protein